MNPPERPFALFPEQASTHAAAVDTLFFFIIGISFAVATLTAVLLIYFAIRYRRRAEDYFPKPIVGSAKLEYGWTIATFVVFMFIFFWSATLYFRLVQPPENAMEIYVTGKQWMWKIQHPSGQTEINELHIPVGQPVRLIMTSEDVIHDFFIPSFRIKQDVMPGRYSYLWFEATKPGVYHLFLRGILRQGTFQDDRLGHGDGAGEIRRVAGWQRQPVDGQSRATAILEAPMHSLPRR